MISVEVAKFKKRVKGGKLGRRIVEALGGEIPTFDALQVTFLGQDLVTRDEVRQVFEWDSSSWAAIETRKNPDTTVFQSASLMNHIVFQQPDNEFSIVTYLNPKELLMDKVESRLTRIARRFDPDRKVKIRGLEDAKRDVQLMQANLNREDLLEDSSEQEGGENS